MEKIKIRDLGEALFRTCKKDIGNLVVDEAKEEAVISPVYVKEIDVLRQGIVSFIATKRDYKIAESFDGCFSLVSQEDSLRIDYSYFRLSRQFSVAISRGK